MAPSDKPPIKMHLLMLGDPACCIDWSVGGDDSKAIKDGPELYWNS